MINLTNGEAAVPSIGEALSKSSEMSMAPMSIGNPSTATALASLGMGRPFVTGTPPTQGFDISPAIPNTYKSPYRIKSGDTLGLILKRAGVSPKTADAAIRSLKGVYNPRNLRIGQTIQVLFASMKPAGHVADRFSGFEIPLDYARRIHVSQAPQGGFKAYEIERDLQTQTVQAEGNIDLSLFAAGSKAGVAPSVMAELVRAFSWDVDFQRDIRKNDHFKVMYERKIDDNGTVVYNGRIVFAALTLSGDLKPIYLHQLKSGAWDYFDDKGQSAKKALMRTPIDGARLSSSFGRRRHPVLGYTKMHKGTDFAAPRGTPIYAAGDGIIVKSGRNGSYGNYIKIRHNSEYATAYAHMKSIKRGRSKGSRVRQGQAIGYVGTTGRSTGPHLHYEILRNGRQTNPMRVKMPSGIKLKGEELANFVATRDRIQAMQASLNPGASKVAQR
ncbi:MAG: peptidoglycan DD-metalloendopeptidase family protein [Magnetovibrio sp.]|nr:peptidoglycan DD-metalloendopeptidase family protein [Magnetovibrio sp.]